MALGTKTSNILDIPLNVSSVVAPFLGDHGYSWEGLSSVRVLSIPNGSLSNYDETSASAPFGSPVLVVPAEQVLALAYNKSMLLRIQRTQMQDIPVGRFAKTVALQQGNQVFIPAHDAYSLGKIYAAVPAGNKIAYNSGRNDFGLKTAIDKVRTAGGTVGNMVSWITYTFSATIQDKINYTGASEGFMAGKTGRLGKYQGSEIIEVPDSYMFGGVSAIVADKSAIVNVKPKMDPKNGGLVIIEVVPGFSGSEIQLRDRSDTFVLSKKTSNVASVETAGSTTTTT